MSYSNLSKLNLNITNNFFIASGKIRHTWWGIFSCDLSLIRHRDHIICSKFLKCIILSLSLYLSMIASLSLSFLLVGGPTWADKFPLLMKCVLVRVEWWGKSDIKNRRMEQPRNACHQTITTILLWSHILIFETFLFVFIKLWEDWA